MKNTSLLVSLSVLSQGVSAWIPGPEHRRSLRYSSPCSILSPSIVALGALPAGYQDIGTRIIREAGTSCGMESAEDLDIEWKAGKIIVTVRGKVYVSNPYEPGEELDEEGEEEYLDDEMEPLDGEEVASGPVSGVDITQLARAINNHLSEDEVGNAIAETHEIEVTTPGASDELSGIMFESYRGFDVICRYEDPKKQKITEITGRLHERTDETTVINIKGRMKKIKNELIESIKLPKAKKEKGAN